MAVIGLARPRDVWLSVRAARDWLAARWEVAWVLPLISIAGIAHAWNMFDFPYYESDEGTYMSQAWAVFNLGQLAPYTYWYDHPPLGWIQLGGLSIVESWFGSFSSSIEPGRISMLLFHLGSSALVYVIARRSGRSTLAATVAVLAFSLSATGLYFQRRVLLDNVATFWLVASLVPLLSANISLLMIWASAAILGIGILSKEIDLIAVPAISLLVWSRVDAPRRALAMAGWIAITGIATSVWVLLATLKGELFPTGSALGGIKPHVSLLETIAYQASRDRDGGFLQGTSAFWDVARSWAADDPLLVSVGTIAAVLAVACIKRHRVPGVIGLVVISLWLFLGRGGVTLRFYVLPLLPLLALELAWLIDMTRGIGRIPSLPTAVRGALAATLGVLVVSGSVLSYRGAAAGFADNPMLLWTSRQAAAQRAAIDWVRTYLPPQSGIVTDMYPWLDLHVPAPPAPRFDLAHWYWKADRDPEIYDGVFGRDWHKIDYLILTPQVYSDAAGLPFLTTTIEHADILASFGNGDWPVIIERTRTPKSMSPATDTLLQRQWDAWNPVLDQDQRDAAPGSTRELQALGLLAATYMDDRAAFDRSWSRMSSQGRKNGALVGPRVDTDVALALAFASARWNDAHLRAAAKQLVAAIWARETVAVKGGRLVVPAASARKGHIVVDLSAISPAAYRVFAAIDPAHEWGQVVDASYRFLAEVQRQKATGGRIGLFPRWAAVEPATGNVIAISAPGGKENLFDAAASQVGWRVGLDWLWNRDERARRVLERLSLPGQELARKSWLGRAYHLDGQPIDGLNTVATYTTSLPPILLSGDPELASSAFTKFVLAPVVAPDFEMPVGPRDRAWAWFGTALMDGGLVDLTRPADRIDWSAVPGVEP